MLSVIIILELNDNNYEPTNVNSPYDLLDSTASLILHDFVLTENNMQAQPKEPSTNRVPCF